MRKNKKWDLSQNQEGNLYFKFCGCSEKMYYTTNAGIKFSLKNKTLCKKCKEEIKKVKELNFYKRNCPKCNVELTTKNKYWNIKAIKEKKLCLVCSSKSHIITDEWRKNMSKNHVDTSGEKNPFYGKHHTEETKDKIRKQNLGKDRFSLDSKIKMSKTRSGNKNHFYGKKHNEETKRKLREFRLELGTPGYNPDACKYINKLNQEKNWNLQHALNGGEVQVIGYSLDAYDKERNIVVEYDEKRHYDVYGNLKKTDIKRQNRIIKSLQCKFYRYDEKRNKFYEVFLLNEKNNKD